MVCGMMGELTKLCAYSFGFGFRYLFVEGEGVGGVAAHHTHTHGFRIEFLGLYSDFHYF